MQELKKYEKLNPQIIDKLEQAISNFQVKDKKDYFEMFQEDTDYEMKDLITLLKDQEKLASKWLFYLADEKERLVFLDEAKKQLYKYKYLFYQKDGNYEYLPDNRAEADLLIQADGEFLHLVGLYQRQEIVTDYVKGLADKIRFMSSEVKQLLEWERYINGG